MARWMIEGEWIGYRSSQDHVVHRHFTTNRKEAESVEKMFSITFTDGTSLRLRVTEVKGRLVKNLAPINGYKSLIDDCRFAGVTSVAALYEKRKPKTEAVSERP